MTNAHTVAIQVGHLKKITTRLMKSKTLEEGLARCFDEVDIQMFAGLEETLKDLSEAIIRLGLH